MEFDLSQNLSYNQRIKIHAASPDPLETESAVRQKVVASPCFGMVSYLREGFSTRVVFPPLV